MFIFFLIPIICSNAFAVEQGFPIIKSEKFKLFPGKKNNPFSIIIPLNLKYFGEVRTHVVIKSISKGKLKLYSRQGILRLLFLNQKYRNNNKKQIPKHFRLKVKHFFDSKKSLIKYYIDEVEFLGTKGKYDLMLSNMTNQTIAGEIFYTYPGSKQESIKSQRTQSLNRPDLVIESISLTKTNHVLIRIKNKGKQVLPIAAWGKKQKQYKMLEIHVNGKKVDSVTLNKLDPEKTLLKPHARIKYITSFRIFKHVLIKAVINPGKRIKEPL
jgi:hypothetical protein